MSPQYSCSICAKSFENSKQQTRHASYCRKKARNPLRPRKKSCFTCTKAKTQCDADFPACSRCSKKGIECTYPQYPAGPIESQGNHQRSTVVPSPDTNSASSLSSFPDPSGLLWVDLLSGPQGARDEFIDSTHLFQDPLVFGDYDSLSAAPYNENETHKVSSALVHVDKAHFQTSALADQRYSIDFPSVDVSNSMGIEPVLRAPRAFSPKRVLYRQLSLNRKFVICTLVSYPHMLLPGKGMPPFIHPQCRSKGPDHETCVDEFPLPGPLASCAGIIAMWTVKNKDNSAFIWRAIREEQERLAAECFKFDDWDALAAFQAICVYFLLRVSESNDDATDFDIPLIRTMIRLGTRTQGLVAKYSQPSNGYLPTWEGWLLAESLRRTILTLFIVNFLFDYSSGTMHMCSDGASNLAGTSLPCSKALWTAQTRSEWEKEYISEMNFHIQNKQKPPTFGDLMQHDADKSPFGNALDNWLAHVDDFGTLVMAAASLSEGAQYQPS